jgi:transcriptional regulator with XRE-family HTH domain
MAQQKVINFGYFVRSLRERMDLSRVQFISKAGIKLSERRLWQIEMNMPEPKVLPQKFEAIARALGFDRDSLEDAWRSTPVAAPRDERAIRTAETDALGEWVTSEALRLRINRREAAEKAVKLLSSISAGERDRLYASAGAESQTPLRIPRPGKDARLRPAAKPMGTKNKGE